MALGSPNLPNLDPRTSYSFYPYPISSIPTSTSLRGPQIPSSSAQAGPSRDRQAEINHAEAVKKRAEQRALMGLRPAGLAVGRDSEDLDQEEMAMDDERQHTNMFGHRFLLPIGRRQTQMELDAAPSPTPSEPDNERRQEDRLVGDMPTPLVGGEQGGQAEMPVGNGDEEDVDLDDEVEDLDADSGEEGEGNATMEET